jgi:hypothetical protein
MVRRNGLGQAPGAGAVTSPGKWVDLDGLLIDEVCDFRHRHASVITTTCQLLSNPIVRM